VGDSKTIWWLAGWFPSSLDTQAGNFIGRHAEAFAENQRAAPADFQFTVFHFPVYRWGKDIKPKNIVTIPHVEIRCRPIAQLPWRGWLIRGINYFYYRWVAMRELKATLLLQGVPDVVHVHSADKIARLIPPLYEVFRKEGKGAVPLWYTEHWAIFNEVVSDGFGKRGSIFRRDYFRLWEKVTVSAPVSLASQQSMQSYLGGAKPFVLFRNVVDTNVFRPKVADMPEDSAEKANLPFAFLHVSSLEPRKNVMGMLRAFATLKQQHPDWRMQFRIVGGNNELYLSQARTAALGLGLLHIFQPSVAFFGPRDANDVAFQMQCADVFVLFSDMENAPCVISEAHCCGLPVISSSVAGVPEMIHESNGLLVPATNEVALTLAMEQAYLNHQQWSREKIAQEAAAKYNPSAVAAVLNRSYQNLIEPCVE